MDLDHHHDAAATMRPPEILDYRLTGENAGRAVELGLAEADWYQCAVPRATMRDLLVRRDGPAIRDTIIWLGLIIVGRDPEIVVPRPPNVRALVMGLFGLTGYPHYFSRILIHSSGRMTEDEKTFIPESEYGKACTGMLEKLGVSGEQIAFDEF